MAAIPAHQKVLKNKQELEQQEVELKQKGKIQVLSGDSCIGS